MGIRIANTNIDITARDTISQEATRIVIETADDINVQDTQKTMMKRGIEEGLGMRRLQILTKIYLSQTMRYLSQSSQRPLAIPG